jgi:hypothetical protein
MMDWSSEDTALRHEATLDLTLVTQRTIQQTWYVEPAESLPHLCGVLARAFCQSMMSDTRLYQDFWSLVEHLLNTVLFTLGGLVWGSIIANADTEGRTDDDDFTGKDWGYLFLLYVL